MPAGLAPSGVRPDMEPVGVKTDRVVLFLSKMSLKNMYKIIRKASNNRVTTYAPPVKSWDKVLDKVHQ